MIGAKTTTSNMAQRGTSYEKWLREEHCHPLPSFDWHLFSYYIAENLMALPAICEDLYSRTLELPLDSDRDLLITGHVLHMLSKLATFGNTQKSSY